MTPLEIYTFVHPLDRSKVSRAAMGLIQLKIELPSSRLTLIERGFETLQRRVNKEGIQIYGVTTGFGDSARHSLEAGAHGELQQSLLSYLSCAFGEMADLATSRATLLLRIIALGQGYSAVSPRLVQNLISLHNGGYAPVIPLEGSLGASGDLIPLASIGLALRGQGECYAPDGSRVASSQVLKTLGLEAFDFPGKDALGLVNGTSMMTAIACLALQTFENNWLAMTRSVGGALMALRADPSAFSILVNDRAKTHPGQSQVARDLRALCGWQDETDFAKKRDPGEHQENLQDPYGLRCTPQILGPCLEAFEHASTMVEREINSANDNPLLDPDSGSVSSGGNFYGGSIALAMDQLAWAVAHSADLLDRQILLLVTDRTNRGLPSNLTGNKDGTGAHHGFKGVHQYATSLTAEIMRLAVPCSIFSRSTESHNQDKISLGTHSARNAKRSIELLNRLVALHSACAAQALELRRDQAKGFYIPEPLLPWLSGVREHLSRVEKDRPLGQELSTLAAAIQAGRWNS